MYISRLFLFIFTGIIAFPAQSLAKTHYVDPGYKNGVQDGSERHPWTDLGKLVKGDRVADGDTVLLKSGNYGRLVLSKRRYNKTVTIAVDKGHVAEFGNVQLRQSKNLHLKGFKVSPIYLPGTSDRNIVEVMRGSEDITIEGFDVFSRASIEGWSKEKWNTVAVNGINVVGKKISLLNNQVKNVRFGILVSSSHSIVKGNLVENFSGDGMRGLGDHSLFEGNTIKNCFQVNSNHADGFQSWSVGKNNRVGTGAVTGITLRKNLIINFEDPEQPFRCEMQGIGLFDGMYVDWVIENNIVVADHWHGITVMGAKNVRIINNTVYDPQYGNAGPAWIRVWEHKNGTKSEGNFVANNLASSYSSSKIGVLKVKNLRIYNEKGLFVDSKNHDFRLRTGSRAVDAGMSGLKVSEDYFGNPRPSGSGVDVGAVELQQ